MLKGVRDRCSSLRESRRVSKAFSRLYQPVQARLVGVTSHGISSIEFHALTVFDIRLDHLALLSRVLLTQSQRLICRKVERDA